MQRLHLLGLNHTTAPLEVRERLAFNPTQRAAAMAAFRQKFPQCEAVLLSTCNRVELYTARKVHGHPRAEEVVEFLSSFHSVPVDSMQPHVYHQSERGLVEHLFGGFVARFHGAGRDANTRASTGSLRSPREQSCVGPLLNPLFQRAIAVGKQVLRETPLAEGRLSIASVAVDYAGRIFDHFDDKTVLCIGAGKMAQLVLRSFAGLSPKKLLVCNRDVDKAALLAKQFNGDSVTLEALDEHLSSVDIVITSTGSSQPIITSGLFSTAHKRRRYRPIFMIDIAMPRDIEASVGEFENVYLYNLDDLQQVVSQTQTGRQGTIDSARQIVRAAVDDYVRAHRVRALGPVIDQLYKRYHQLAQEELSRTLAKLPDIGEAEKSHLEDLARRIVNKLLHDPVQALRSADDAHTPASQYVHAMERLFKLTDSIANDDNDPDSRENPI